MSFVSKNEIDKFRYDDCVINEISMDKEDMSLEVEALIVRSDNSQNTNYTDSYADVTKIVFSRASVVMIIKEGYRRFDADDNLIEDVKDAVVEADKVNISDFAQQYLVGISRDEDGKYSVEIEFADEDPTALTDVYKLVIEAEDVTVTWDKYMNRVQG